MIHVLIRDVSKEVLAEYVQTPYISASLESSKHSSCKGLVEPTKFFHKCSTEPYTPKGATFLFFFFLFSGVVHTTPVLHPREKHARSHTTRRWPPNRISGIRVLGVGVCPTKLDFPLVKNGEPHIFSNNICAESSTLLRALLLPGNQSPHSAYQRTRLHYSRDTSDFS